MAIVAYTSYSGEADCHRTNDYLCDGHGSPVAIRINRYLTDGHGNHTLCAGYNCPSDPVLATGLMETVRLNYERQHPPGEGRTKGSVTHIQFYVSPTEEDNVPADERMEMTRELIERTALRNFPSIYIPHDNTPDKHTHISLCPFSVDGTYKLCINNSLLYDLRREMDYICVEHGHSIVECPELWGDKEYRDWFFTVKENSTVKVHPPREKTPTWKQDRKRSRSFSKSKETQASTEARQLAQYKKLTDTYHPDLPHLFYTSPVLYDPSNPSEKIHLKRVDPKGRELGELELSAIALYYWADCAQKELCRRELTDIAELRSHFKNLQNKAGSSALLLKDLDIRTIDELIRHTKEVGSDIGDLKQDIRRQETILSRMDAVMEHIDQWESNKDPDAIEWLALHHCGNEDQISDAKKRYERAHRRKNADEALLEDRSAEYRHLKKAEATLHPTSSKDLWQDFLEKTFQKELTKGNGRLTTAQKNLKLYQLGDMIGLSQEDMDNLISGAEKLTHRITWVEYRGLMRITFAADGDVIFTLKEELSEAYAYLRQLHEQYSWLDDFPILGPCTLFVFCAFSFFEAMEEAETEEKIESLKHELETILAHTKEKRLRQQEHLKEAKLFYDAMTQNASNKEIHAAKLRFYRTAACIVERWDIVDEIDSRKQNGDFDNRINYTIGQAIKNTSSTTAHGTRIVYSR